MGVVDYGMDIQQAVNAPRFHHQWLPDKIFLEPGFSPDTIELLRQKGHDISGPQGKNGGYWSDGECIEVDPRSGELLGASDYRHSTARALGF